jgi:hypothetical protein
MKVTEIFFEENLNYPTFILENGEIKKPMFNGSGNVTWLTKFEIKKQSEETIKNKKNWWK